MKVKDLIKKLQACDPELEVYGWCNHGQTPEKVGAPSIFYFENNPSYEHTTYEEEADENGYTKQAILL